MRALMRPTKQKAGIRMAYPKGTKIRVSIEGTVGRPFTDLADDTDYKEFKDTADLINTTNRVIGGGWTHFVFLRSTSITALYPSTSKSDPGATVRIEFDAVVTGDERKGPAITTKVNELGPDGLTQGTTHYLFLDCAQVKKIEEPEPEPEPELTAEETYQIGTKVRVRFSGKVGESAKTAPGRSVIGTCDAVKDTSAFTHYIYLGPDAAGVTGSKFYGGIVDVDFIGTVSGKFEDNDNETTEVRVDGTGYKHYVYLSSPNVTVTVPVKPADPVPVPEVTAAGKELVSKRITSDDAEIMSTDVLKRIVELEEGAEVVRYRITRNRNGEVLNNPVSGVFRTLIEALEFLDAEDYARSKFTVEPVTLRSDEDEDELSQLKRLSEAGTVVFGFNRWTGGVLIRNDDYFTEEWGQEQAMEKLGVRDAQLDEWPLNQISWGVAVDDLLSSDYLTVDFNRVAFWGKYTG